MRSKEREALTSLLPVTRITGDENQREEETQSRRRCIYGRESKNPHNRTVNKRLYEGLKRERERGYEAVNKAYAVEV